MKGSSPSKSKDPKSLMGITCVSVCVQGHSDGTCERARLDGPCNIWRGLNQSFVLAEAGSARVRSLNAKA
jgi:hypothetical protein